MGAVNSSQTTPAEPVLILVVGGVDPSGGAGLLRDVATVTARGARAHAVGTAWTEQGAGVHRVEPRGPDAVREALRWAIATLRPAAVKIGMAVGPETAAALVDGLTAYDGPVVVDPVLATSRGGALWAAPTAELLPLLRRAALVTPNAPEAAALAGTPVATLAQAEGAARALVATAGLRAVLVKGGHIGGDGDPAVTDVLATGSGVERFSRPRVMTSSSRGTGCRLATAIAVELGRGAALPAAVAVAATWLAGELGRDFEP
jgi:hydroxymethylpyrimidine/phosphomethylpyrimidine kinase